MQAFDEDDDITSLSGPVVEVDGSLKLMIPLLAGGDRLVECSEGIGKVVGVELHINIPAWLAQQLGIHAGMLVTVDNRNGKFNIYPEYGPTH